MTVQKDKNQLFVGLLFGLIAGGVMALLANIMPLPSQNGNWIYGLIFWVLNYFCSVPQLIAWNTVGIMKPGHAIWSSLIVVIYFVVFGALFSVFLLRKKGKVGWLILSFLLVHALCLYLFLHH